VAMGYMVKKGTLTLETFYKELKIKQKIALYQPRASE
jgi:hypothetical protein